MIKEKPFIHLFETPGGYYIYDVNTNAILSVNKMIYELLQTDDLNIKEIGSDFDTINAMRADGFLSTRRLKKIIHPDNDVLEYYLDRKLNMITLQITQNCNLRCSYCVYSGKYQNREHSNKKMSIDVAKKGIDFLINHSSDSDEIGIGFYGGEPLLEFEMIKECIEYAEKRAEGKNLILSLTVNGTLLNGEIAEYFQKHRIYTMVSLDGPKEVHDKNRKFSDGRGSFDVIYNNLKMLKDKCPEFMNKVGFSVVLDPQIDFGCLNEFLLNSDIFDDAYWINMSYVNQNYIKNEVDVQVDYNYKRKYELFKVYLSKLGKLDEKYISRVINKEYFDLKRLMSDERALSKELPEKGHHAGPCIPGRQRLFLNVNGDFYPCERVSESSEMTKIGNIETGFDIDKVRKLLNIGCLNADNCKNCWAFKYCTLCATHADNLTDLSRDKINSWCNISRKYVDDMLKNYCSLVELGHNFDNDITIMDYYKR